MEIFFLVPSIRSLYSVIFFKRHQIYQRKVATPTYKLNLIRLLNRLVDCSSKPNIKNIQECTNNSIIGLNFHILGFVDKLGSENDLAVHFEIDKKSNQLNADSRYSYTNNEYITLTTSIFSPKDFVTICKPLRFFLQDCKGFFSHVHRPRAQPRAKFD